MEVGRWYRVQWYDDPQEYIVKFLQRDRGFIIFVGDDGFKLVARPESICAIEVKDGDLGRVHRASPAFKAVDRQPSSEGDGG